MARKGDEGVVRRAAQYLRMSAEHQRYSTQNQAAAIAAYAADAGYVVVKTYEDNGVSGLRLKGRMGLASLLSDVVGRTADYDTILVYDVSRWGRFQDPDQSAHYEFLCREAGVDVEYCAEAFENDGTLGSAILKHLRRAMAGEFSRDLSVKVAAGQRRLASLGFWIGGSPGYAFRRALVDGNGTLVMPLAAGERKAVQHYRTTLVVGPPEEVAVVRRIYDLFVNERMLRKAIARRLNQEVIASSTGRPWTAEMVREILQNEKYIGNYVAHKSVRPLGAPLQWVPDDARIRINGVWAPMVSQRLFRAAQTLLRNRVVRMNDDEMLAGLRDLLKSKGRLSAVLIDREDGLPCAQVYRDRFQGLRGAYERVGYIPPHHRGRWLRGVNVRPVQSVSSPG